MVQLSKEVAAIVLYTWHNLREDEFCPPVSVNGSIGGVGPVQRGIMPPCGQTRLIRHCIYDGSTCTLSDYGCHPETGHGGTFVSK